MFQLFSASILKCTLVHHHNKPAMLEMSTLGTLANFSFLAGYYFPFYHVKMSKTPKCQQKSMIIGGKSMKTEK